MQFYTGQVQVRQNETAACATLEHSPRQRPGCSRLSAFSLKHPTKRMAIWEVTGMRMLHERYTTTSDNACLQTALARRLHGSTFRTRLQITTVRSSGWSGKKARTGSAVGRHGLWERCRQGAFQVGAGYASFPFLWLTKQNGRTGN